MAVNQQRRQKKLARQKAKRKSQQKREARAKSGGIAARLARFAEAPIFNCYRDGGLFEFGMGGVLISRRLPSGQVAFAVFLMDTYCLGVKDAVCGVVSEGEYRERLQGDSLVRNAMTITPESARKLVESAVDFARDLGFPPHPAYRAAHELFGDIDASAEPDVSFGRDGTPCFVSGPFDTPERCRTVTSILNSTCGADGFDVVLFQEGESLPGFLVGDDGEIDGEIDGEEFDEPDELDGYFEG